MIQQSTPDTDVPEELEVFRQKSAELSGGRSNETIWKLVIQMIKSSGVSGSILDFGAGQGHLLTRIRKNGFQGSLTGVDLLPRPDGLNTDIDWYSIDLNRKFDLNKEYDIVICSEVIEHLENPRATFRLLAHHTRPGGKLLLTMPNQESIRSLVGLLFKGHFTFFLDSCYPAHITALLRLDITRLCAETGYSSPQFLFSDNGAIPKITWLTWQKISFGLLNGRLFSDNIGMIATRVSTQLDLS